MRGEILLGCGSIKPQCGPIGPIKLEGSRFSHDKSAPSSGALREFLLQTSSVAEIEQLRLVRLARAKFDPLLALPYTPLPDAAQAGWPCRCAGRTWLRGGCT